MGSDSDDVLPEANMDPGVALLAWALRAWALAAGPWPIGAKHPDKQIPEINK